MHLYMYSSYHSVPLWISVEYRSEILKIVFIVPTITLIYLGENTNEINTKYLHPKYKILQRGIRKMK